MSIQPADYPLWLRVVIVITLALFAINLFFFLGPLIHFAAAVSITANDLGSWLGALVATFVGAFLAFQFGLRQRELQRVNDEVTAGNLALSTLIEMWDRQVQFQTDVVAPFRNRHDALILGRVWSTRRLGQHLSLMGFRLEQIWRKPNSKGCLDPRSFRNCGSTHEVLFR
jgi:hypothetical protein